MESSLRALACAVALAAQFLGAVSVRAADVEAKYFGHRVAIAKKDYFDILEVDGKPLLQQETHLTFEEIAIVGGVGVVVGLSNPGGNACEPSPFVVSFPRDEPVKIDGPLDSCRIVKWTVSPDRMEFSVAASPTVPGDQWLWTADAGFHDHRSVPFVPSQGKGWASLRSRSITHPAELFENKELAAAVNEVLGADRREVMPMIEGPGSAVFRGDLLVASGCMPHDCADNGFVVVANIQDRSVFVAWKLRDKPIVVRPQAKKWPDNEKSELRQWAAASKKN